MDMDRNITVTAARNSVLMEKEVIEYLLNLLKNSDKQGIGKLSDIIARSVVSSINRGLKHMIETLKDEFVGLLA